MADRSPEPGKPDPLLVSSDGNEAKILARRDVRAHWPWVAAGIGSAAIAVAMMFWGDNKRWPNKSEPDARKPS